MVTVALTDQDPLLARGLKSLGGRSVAHDRCSGAILGIPWALERLEDKIVAAFDGDPTTEAPA
ncbi:MAG: hypothetical protein LC799_12255 [Actinobacteria bacterium]|nr:hypothetical protein [Actinomycetota bacterium]